MLGWTLDEGHKRARALSDSESVLPSVSWNKQHAHFIYLYYFIIILLFPILRSDSGRRAQPRCGLRLGRFSCMCSPRCCCCCRCRCRARSPAVSTATGGGTRRARDTADSAAPSATTARGRATAAARARCATAALRRTRASTRARAPQSSTSTPRERETCHRAVSS